MEMLMQSCRATIGPSHGTASEGAVDWTHGSMISEKRARSSSGVSVGLMVFAIR